MKKFILRRKLVTIEKLEVEADNSKEAGVLLTEFNNRPHSDDHYVEGLGTYEYIGGSDDSN